MCLMPVTPTPFVPHKTKLKSNQIIQRFGRSAATCKKAGISGVQIRGAHGYLVSQFLSPHHNQRTDEWGGSPENWRRFLMAVYAEIHHQVGAFSLPEQWKCFDVKNDFNA
jgi:2,4-dienoyl-CoA reductase-like NADH-dependent reductase (Old Yellow Enzyme family)